MAFTDPRYFFFLLLSVVLVAVAPAGRGRLIAVLILNIAFLYLLRDQWYTVPIVAAISFFGARALERRREGYLRLALFVALLGALFLPLLYSKYMFAGYARLLVLFPGLAEQVAISNQALPIGLSFYTFLAAGYLIDVYVENYRAERSPLKFGVMMSFFPMVTAGPIERGERFLSQLGSLGAPGYQMAVAGLRALLLGVLLKVVVADTLAPEVNRVFSAPHHFGATDLWLANLYFAFQVYADFAGYSLIAIGSARLLGIELITNFRQPYLSQTVAEFWRRWHISLSSWFRDYVFTPLQFRLRKRGSVGITVALVATFLLVGIWHGAGTKYALFGLIHGLLVAISTFTIAARDALWRRLAMPPLIVRVVRTAVTFVLVYMTLVLFRAENTAQAFAYYRGMLTGFAPATLPLALPTAVIALALVVDIVLEMQNKANSAVRWLAYYAGVALICGFAIWNTTNGAADVGFIYFKF